MIAALQAWLTSHGPYMAAGVYCFFGGAIPMLNTELFISFLGGLMTHDPLTVLLVALSAAVGRMLGTSLVYWSVLEGMNLGFKKTSKLNAQLKKWHNKVENMPHVRLYAMTLTGSIVGLPPLYLFTMVLGALKINWREHFFIGIVGSLIKYTLFLVMGAKIVSWLHLA
jgi:membrane protein YqaA with SNARE-associated domain